MCKMKKNIIGALIFGLLVMNAGAQIVVSTPNGFNRSDAAIGVEIRLNSSLAVWDATKTYTLNSFNFNAAAAGGTYWLNVYQAGSSAEASGFNFSSNDTTGLTFLGASANSIDTSSFDNGSALDYTFSGITVSPDRDVFIVFSTTATAGSFVQANLKSNKDTPTYSNLLTADVEDINIGSSAEYITFDGEFAEVVSGPSAPTAPTGLAATATNASVSLDWDDNTESNVIYSVYRSTNSGNYGSALTNGLANSDYIDNTVSNFTTYYYVVTAVDTNSAESAESDEVSATPSDPSNDPPAFTSESIVATNAMQDVAYISSIADNASDPENDDMTFSKTDGPDWLSVASNGGLSGTPGYSDTGTNTFTVEVTAAGGSDQAELKIIVDVDTETPPAAPTGLSAVAGIGSITLDWADNSEGDLDSYSVYRSTNSGIYSSALATNLSPSAYTDNDVSHAVTYYYVVRAIDIHGNESAQSSQVSATATTNVPVQINLLDSSISTNTPYGGTVDLTAAPYAAWGYDTDGLDNGFSTVKSNTAAPAVTLNSAGGTTKDFGWSFDTGSGAQSSAGGVNGMANGDGYTLTFNGAVSTNATQRLTLYLGAFEGGNDSITMTVVPTLSGGISNVTGAAHSYTCDNSTSIGGVVTAIYTLEFKSSTEPNLVLDFTASNTSGSRGAGVSGYTLEVLSDAGAPTGLAAAPGDDSVSLDWDDNTGDDTASYKVYRSTNSGSYSNALVTGLTSSDYTDNSAVNYTKYYYVVAAVDGATVESPVSGEVYATPADVGNQAPAFTSDPIVETNALEDAAYSATLADNASDPESDPMNFVKLDGPDWLTVAADGGLSGTPVVTNAGLNSFTVLVDGAGGSDTAELQITVDADTVTPPDAPTGLSDALGVGSINLDWDNNTEDDLASYSVYRSATSGGYGAALVTNVTSSEYVDNTVSNYTRYYYTVTATDIFGNESVKSSEVNPLPPLLPPPAAPASRIRVFIESGQSNAGGRGEPDGQPTHTDIPFFADREILTSLHPYSGGGTLFGPEFKFGRDLADLLGSDSSERVAIIKQYAGGTSITEWSLGDTEWVNLTQRIDAGLAALSSQYPTAEIAIEGMIWIQGERDARVGSTNFSGTATTVPSTVYEQRLTQLIADVRTAYGTNISFVAARLSTNAKDLSLPPPIGYQDGFESVRQGTEDAVNADPNADFVDTDDLTFWKDDLHYDTDGVLELGSRFAVKMDELLSPAAGGYSQWLSDNGVADTAANFYEYAMNSDPNDGLAPTNRPVFSKAGAGFIYVHPQRSDDASLVYTVETTTNLLDSGSWDSVGTTAIGTNETVGTLDFVTNEVDTAENEKFIRLKIEK